MCFMQTPNNTFVLIYHGVRGSVVLFPNKIIWITAETVKALFLHAQIQKKNNCGSDGLLMLNWKRNSWQ